MPNVTQDVDFTSFEITHVRCCSVNNSDQIVVCTRGHTSCAVQVYELRKEQVHRCFNFCIKSYMVVVVWACEGGEENEEGALSSFRFHGFMFEDSWSDRILTATVPGVKEALLDLAHF